MAKYQRQSMFLSNLKFKRNTLFVILLLFLLLNSIYLYNINKKVLINTQINTKIVNILTINKDLNLYFGERTNLLNYDVVNRKINNFQDMIDYLYVTDQASDFFSKKNNKQLLDKISKNFEIKKTILYNYVEKNALLSSSVRYFSKILETVLIQTDNQAYKKHVLEVYASILQYELGKGTGFSSLKNQIDTHLKNAPNGNLKNYFKHAQIVLKSLDGIYSLYKQNSTLSIDDDLVNLRHNFDNYANAVVNQLYANVAIFMIIMIIFVFTISFLMNKIQKRTNKLSQFQHAIQNSDNAIVITDLEHKIQYVNRAFEKTTGYTSELAIGQTPAILQSGLHDKSFYADVNKKIKNGESWSGEFINRRKDGEIIYEKSSIYSLKDEDGQPEGFLAIKLDITNEKKYLQEIESKNMEVLTRYQIDDISGLWSKNILNDELNRKAPGYLIYFKIKNYEDIRFFYGTITSAKIIRKIANNLKKFISVYKINGQPFSVGEDDFCIWYRHKKPSENLLKAIYEYFKRNPIEIDDTLHPIELFVGVSSSRDLPQGDRLLQGNIAYQKAERNSVPPFAYYEINNELEREYRHNIVISGRIRHAIDENLVTVQCQPIFNTQTKEIYSYEVLMRMYDENGRMMFPGEFLKVAKQSSLYTPLMQEVIAQTFKLSENYPDTKFSINMSTIDMLDQDTTRIFLSRLKSIAHPENIIVEILESEGIENYDAIYPFLEELKANGCMLSIDDFGSGYSNYYRIMQLNVDYIKIDGSIIKELPYDEGSRVVVETIVGFAKRQGYEVVAEFVSSKEIYEAIKKYGIEYTQGYYFGKPEFLKLKK